jgi:hypothetical protein
MNRRYEKCRREKKLPMSYYLKQPYFWDFVFSHFYVYNSFYKTNFGLEAQNDLPLS